MSPFLHSTYVPVLTRTYFPAVLVECEDSGLAAAVIVGVEDARVEFAGCQSTCFFHYVLMDVAFGLE